MSGKPLKNPRHEAFARHYVRLGVARHAYAAAGYQARMPVTPRQCAPVDAAAARLLKHIKVEQRITRLRQTMAKRADITEDSIADELEQARSIAISERMPAAAVSATVAKAKLAGLMIDRRENTNVDAIERMSEQELRDYLSDNTHESDQAQPTHAQHETEQ